MPSIIKFESDVFSIARVSINGDTLEIDPSLKPKPDDGVEVLFWFDFSETAPRRIIGMASLCPRNWGVDPGIWEELDGLWNLEAHKGEIISPQYFNKTLRESPSIEVSLHDLVYVFLESRIHHSVEGKFLDAMLKAYLASHTVRAKIVNLVSRISVQVYFDRGDSHIFSFDFKVDRIEAEQLFEFEEANATA